MLLHKPADNMPFVQCMRAGEATFTTNGVENVHNLYEYDWALENLMLLDALHVNKIRRQRLYWS
jgi:hypothetical protein